MEAESPEDLKTIFCKQKSATNGSAFDAFANMFLMQGLEAYSRTRAPMSERAKQKATNRNPS
jgi:hypothetical protein